MIGNIKELSDVWKYQLPEGIGRFNHDRTEFLHVRGKMDFTTESHVVKAT